jgi:flavin reductase (DIM6/NTAB) family NADH-FMN oxidoreductase RutF
MPKTSLKPNTAIYPAPAILVTVGDAAGKSNIITLAWAGVVCSQPPMIGISIRPSRYSADLLKANGEFVVNVPDQRLLWAVDHCGVVSGRDVDKWDASTLTPVPAEKVRPPLISQCPICMECVVRQVISLGSHDLYLGEVVALHVDDSALDEHGRIDAKRLAPIAYVASEYWSLAERIGQHGFSSKK